MNNNTDQQTLELIEKVQTQRAEIAKINRANWQTTCSLSLSGDNRDSVNLHTVNKIDELVGYASQLLSKKAYHEQAEALLGVEVGEFLWQGFTVEHWLEDIKTRIGKIRIADKQRKLETLESRLDKIISPQLKAKLELEDIAASLNE